MISSVSMCTFFSMNDGHWHGDKLVGCWHERFTLRTEMKQLTLWLNFRLCLICFQLWLAFVSAALLCIQASFFCFRWLALTESWLWYSQDLILQDLALDLLITLVSCLCGRVRKLLKTNLLDVVWFWPKAIKILLWVINLYTWSLFHKDLIRLFVKSQLRENAVGCILTFMRFWGYRCRVHFCWITLSMTLKIQFYLMLDFSYAVFSWFVRIFAMKKHPENIIWWAVEFPSDSVRFWLSELLTFLWILSATILIVLHMPLSWCSPYI